LETKENIMKTGIVKAILDKQNEGGYWGERLKFYLDKYSGTV
jgi:hypothetical protein